MPTKPLWRTKEKETKTIQIKYTFVLPHVFLIILEKTVKEEVLFFASMGTIEYVQMQCIRLRNNQTRLCFMFASIPYFRMCSILSEPDGAWLHREAGQLGLTRHSVYLTHHLYYEYGYY